MTEYGLPFDGVLTGDASKAPYSSDEWARMWQLTHGVGTSFPNYGVFKGSGDGTHEPLQVLATAPISSNVQVQIGAGLIHGRFYETTAAVTLAINANASGNARIDTVIARADYALQTIRLLVLQGTPAASPVRPTLTQNTTFWEVPLADVAVASGFATLAQTTITQRQRDVITASKGWMPYAYPTTYLVNGDYDSSTIALNTSGFSLAIPFTLAANLLLQEIVFRHTTNPALGINWGWDIYIEDSNDANTVDNTLRRVAQSNGDFNAVATNSPSLGASGGAVALSPGHHWLVIQRRLSANTISLGALIAAGSFSPTTCRSKTTSLPNGDTLDFSTGWTNQTRIPGVHLRGRVFGETSIY